MRNLPVPPCARAPVPAAFAIGVLITTAVPAIAQPALTSDLWRVAAGTLVVPAALASDGSAALWTPAFTLPDNGHAGRVGVETVHSPSEIGVNGSVVTVGIRAGKLGTVHALYGRIGLEDLVRTETSPEATGGAIPAFAQVLSVGIAHDVARHLTGGTAVRLLSGRLDARSTTRWALDVGALYGGIPRVTLAVATRFLDPTFRRGESASAYSFGVEYRTEEGPLVGTTGRLSFRYGATWSQGEGAQQLYSLGLALAGAAEIDAGAARESAVDFVVWRSRFGLAVLAGRYRVYLGRDGGANGFGATYRFGLAARFL